ncbi:cellulose binding domain-containing protein [Micromonospora sp. DT53]|uniref:cellulose binding domain-containing protein n=1 Tax=Micromonospora sp. DT53 TaxID=3393444 RepID=UPI003CF26274
MSNRQRLGNGYIGGVEIINNWTTPIDGWTLTWAWPTGWQQVSSGWSATHGLHAQRHRLRGRLIDWPGASMVRAARVGP